VYFVEVVSVKDKRGDIVFIVSDFLNFWIVFLGSGYSSFFGCGVFILLVDLVTFVFSIILEVSK
jgi:hypothetical protein